MKQIQLLHSSTHYLQSRNHKRLLAVQMRKMDPFSLRIPVRVVREDRKASAPWVASRKHLAWRWAKVTQIANLPFVTGG